MVGLSAFHAYIYRIAQLDNILFIYNFACQTRERLTGNFPVARAIELLDFVLDLTGFVLIATPVFWYAFKGGFLVQ